MGENGYVPRLKEHYDNVVRGALVERFSYSNALQTPKLDKVVVNIGAGEAVGDSKKIGVNMRRFSGDYGPKTHCYAR